MCTTLTEWSNNRLNDLQRGDNLQQTPVKKDSILDLLTMTSDRVKVKFQLGPKKYEIKIGRWCNTCKSVFTFDLQNATEAYFNAGLTMHLSDLIESTRLSIRGVTHPVTFTFVSTIQSTRTSVKRQTYQCTIGDSTANLEENGAGEGGKGTRFSYEEAETA